ncbi:hypothetical protein Syun_005181 [Stephania yunnanensis]|uniref:B box-type domain-containing protein n=1 Tax=Stephania yunnanensis TaxID=152371 RepID=A0AAP0L8F9_9MAGN
MKIQCDVCHKDEASVFCSADEAALCNGCDHRVHHANKLASKHHRFSLLQPSSKDAPRCDICQEKRAFLFCREDRAILCRECDFSIHTTNEHTQKHNRFLLTGVKLSSCTAIAAPTTTSCDATASADASSSMDANKIINNHNTHQSSVKKKDLLVSLSPNLDDPPSAPTPQYSAATTVFPDHQTSSISEYLIEMLPGWHVEDLLDSSTHNHGFCKTDDLLPFLDEGFIQTSDGQFSSSEVLATRVPQAAPNAHCHHRFQSHVDDRMNGLFKELKEVINPKPKSSTRWIDHGLTVPQISPASNKRSRPLW